MTDNFLSSISGVKVFVTPLATEHGGYRFGVAKNRSKRVLKKLEKKLGPREIRLPACYHIAGLGFRIHPEMWAKMKQQIVETKP